MDAVDHRLRDGNDYGNQLHGGRVALSQHGYQMSRLDIANSARLEVVYIAGDIVVLQESGKG